MIEGVSEARVIPTPAVDPPFTAEEEAALAEAIELDVEIRRRVLLLHRALDRVDHYALLGVPRTADRKEIKRAYYELASKVHPDKYFRKDLGSFGHRMAIVFGRLTQAHDALTVAEKRAEYDAYLDEQRRARSIEELLADAMAQVQRAQEIVEQEVQAEEAAPAAVIPSPPPDLPPSPALSAAARRDALARRLRGGRPFVATPMPGPIAPAASPAASDAVQALRRRYEERIQHARDVQARKYLANAEAALAAGDAVAAANAFRVAQALSPDDRDLATRTAEAQAKADGVLCETYTRQAGYEEKSGQWADAARSWSRVARTRPDDATAHERAANALVKAEGDLHEASRMAQRAAALEPKKPQFRVTLANVYVAAGLGLNARRELETAAQLAPHDGNIQALLKRVGKSA
jgi:curved DNA-binding protein CbpA